MAIKPLNSVAGFSVGEYPTTVIVDANGNITASAFTATNTANLGAIGNVKITGGSSGQVISTDGTGNLSFIAVSTSGLSNGTSNISVINNGNITFSSAGNANIMVVTGTGVNVSGTLNATGNANVNNLGTNRVFAAANITTPQFISNVATGTAPLVVSSTTLVSNLNADLLDGYNTATANTASTIVVRDANGNVSANFFIGNGSQLTGLPSGTSITNGTSNVSIPTSGGNVNTSVGGTANVLIVTSTGVNVAGTLNATGNANVGNIGATRGVFTNISGEGGNISNIQGGNVSGAVASATTAGTVTTNAQPNITSVGTLTSLSVTGNITGANFIGNLANGNSDVNIPAANGNINFDVAGNANVVVVTGTGINVAGTLNATGNATVGNISATNANITAMTATGNISANNLSTTNKITAGNGLQVTTGTLSVSNGNLDVTGNINVTGNLNYSNVTDLVVGDPLIYIGANNTSDLYDLGIVASYNNGTYYHTGIARNATTDYWTFFDGVVAEPTTVIDWANATYPTVKMGNLLTTGNANITGIANITGNVVAGNVYANSGTVGASLLTGTLTTAAQPNITSVGTLTSLSVTGNASAANFVGVLANGNSNVNITSNANITFYVAGNATARMVLTSTGANIAGTANITGNANVGNIGAATAVFTTGNITTINSGLIQNGNSNVTITANANVTINAVGGARITATSTGANVTGTLGVSGNANVGNLGAAQVLATANITAPQLISNVATGTAPLVVTSTTQVANLSVATAGTAGTVTTAAQPNITSVGTLTSLAVTGNVTAGNISATNGNLTTANVSGNIILGNASVTTAVSWGSATTTSITANQVVASFSVTGVVGVEFLVKGIDSTGSKYSVSTVHAVTDGVNVDYSTFGGVSLGGFTGTFAVDVSGGQLRLLVTPASSNSTVWTTQYRFV